MKLSLLCIVLLIFAAGCASAGIPEPFKSGDEEDETRDHMESVEPDIATPFSQLLAFTYLEDDLRFSVYIVQDGDMRQMSAGEQHSGEQTFSPDGSRLMYMQDGRIYMVNVDGADNRAITPENIAASYPAWSPDGSYIAYIGGLREQPGTYTLYVLTSPGAEPRSLSLSKVLSYRWMADSRSLLVWGEYNDVLGIYRVGAGMDDVTLVSDAPQFAASEYVEFSPDGKSVAYTAETAGEELASDSALWVMGLGDGTTKEIGLLEFETRFQFSPDSQRIAYVSMSDAYLPTLTVANVDGTGQTQLMELDSGDDSGEIRADSPSWSPDGAYIAICSYEKDGSALFVVNADGSGVFRVTPEGGLKYDVAWS
jgi:Tol biopolymer transport system component